MPCGPLVGFQKIGTHSRVRDGCHVSTFSGRAVTRVEGRLDTALEELRSLINGVTHQINGMTLQHNKMKT